MDTRYLLFWVVLLMVCLSFVYSQGCYTTGWFGSNCQYKCHCENDKCNNRTGQCTDNSKCVKGWFGLACQYQDLSSVPSTTITINPFQTSNTWITDRDDSTCNQDNNLQSVAVAWNITYPLSWFRLTFKESAYAGKFEISFRTNGNILTETPCNNQHIYVIDTSTVDISCQMTVDVMQVVVGGEGVKSLCSLYISGGRNVALKQNTVQSSTYTLEGIERALASNAVDGNTSSVFENNTCTHTDTVDSSPKWTVTFSQSHAINRIVLYNRYGYKDSIFCCPERLIQFGLQTFNTIKETVFSFKDARTTPMLVYTIIVPYIERSVSVVGVTVNSSSGILTLCEVQTFAECDPGTWGLDCNNTCQQSCRTSCDAETGFCKACVGFSDPPACDEECESVNWGINCTQSCSTKCYNQSCNSQTGVCDKGCNGYSDSPVCTTQCLPGKWGVNCINECSSCLNKSCDRFHGKCTLACEVGYTKFPDCSPGCSDGYYSSNCSLPCSQTCKDRKCNYITGHCLQCLTGYQGYMCDEEISIREVQENNSQKTIIGLGIGLGVACATSISFLLVICYLIRRGKQPLRINESHTGQTNVPDKSYDTVASGSEYNRQYEAPVTTGKYQNASNKYIVKFEGKSEKKDNEQACSVYEDDTNAADTYESIEMDKIDSAS
ncbi:unnamed protein product [Lymnaea stagnalis]|uniref:Fucolectin tachylectin-4 pentraxin-1 domain-containing protein n=1 Tax=Lymnaea stagnalis TaxID=6523 RepID=A0AAV2HPT3_LYMST